ncbi:hypothetical protein WAX46_03580 [Bacillus sp. FJAT-53060]|uniref:hypothetical protein n=1 Tax=Bacillus TaxID=1386 RepID=UPI001CF94475|nr:hypothetical protein [Bacillus stratosphericus]
MLNFGDSLYVLVLTFLTYQFTSSTLIASMVAVSQFVGQVLGAVLIPFFMYHFKLKRNSFSICKYVKLFSSVA